MEYYFDEIESCECIGSFENEYVYDIEVEDESHTFIANDILVHNSSFVHFQPILDSCDFKGAPHQFILDLQKVKLESYFKEKFDEYATRFNTTNIQNFELEKISHSTLMVAKKKYIHDLAWKEPGIEYEPQEKITYTGIEVIQSSTPKFAKKILKELITYIFKKGKSLNYAHTIKMLKEYKREFIMQDPDDIATGVSVGDYEKYVLEDRKNITLGEKCPINDKAAAVYNYLLFNSKSKSKYNLIRTGDKMKFYYAKGEYDVFGFLPNSLPYEFAPEVDYDKQFEKKIIEPLNRFIEILGFPRIPGSLMFNVSLF
jgi:DNA polymerase elongation subunit (family B)